MDPAPEIPGGEAPEAAVSGPRTPDHESIVNPERAKVIGALDETLRLMEEAQSVDGLNEEQQHKLNDVRYAKSRTLDIGKTYFSHEPVISETTGKKYRYQERIPTDGMLDFLHSKVLAESAKPPSKQNTELLKKYRSLEQTLMANSRSVRAAQRDPDRLIERVRLEAQLISRSDRNTGDPVQNWYLAEKTISNRLHLIIPRETKPTELSPLPEPDEEEFIGPVMPERLPAPGDPDFIGPTLPPEPDAEEFIAPPLPEDIDLADPSESLTEGDDDDMEIPPSISNLTFNKILMFAGSRHAGVSKYIDTQVSTEITEAEDMGIEYHKNWLHRSFQVAYHRMLTRRGWESGRYGLLRESHRFNKRNEIHTRLLSAMSGVGEQVSSTAYNDAREDIKNIHADSVAIIESARLHVESNQDASLVGDEISDAVDGPLKEFFVDTLLYGDEGMLSKIASGASEEELNREIQRKMYEYVSTHQEDEMIRHYFGQNDKRYGEISQFYATDILESAQNIQEQARINGVGVEMLKDYIEIRLIRAQQERATEIDYTRAERFMAATQGKYSWLTPTKVALAAAVGTSLFQGGIRGAARKAAVVAGVGTGVAASPLLVPVVAMAAGVTVGTAFGALRERQRIKSDVFTVATNQESGIDANESSSFRKSIEDKVVKKMMVRDNQLIEGDQDGDNPDPLTGEPRKSTEYLLGADITSVDVENMVQVEKNRQALSSRIAEIEARLASPITHAHESLFSEVGRISYRGDESVTIQRAQLIEQLVELRKRIQNLPPEAQDLMQQMVSEHRSTHDSILITTKEEQERAFKQMRLKRSIAQGFKMGAIGAVLGLGVQEVLAVSARVSPDVDVPIVNVGEGQTMLEKITPTGIGKFGVMEDAGTTETVNSITVEGTRDVLVDSPEAGMIPDTEKLQSIVETGHGNFQNYRISYDQDNGMSIIDTRTNTPVFDSKDVTINPETGKISIVGDIPNETKGVFREMQFNVDAVDPVNSPIEHTVFGPDVSTYEAAMGTGPDAPLTKIPEGTVWIDGKDGAHTLIVADRPDIVLIPDAKIVDGGMTWDKNYTYPEYDSRIGERTDGLFSQMKISYEDGTPTISTESTPLFGENGVWKEMATHIDSREWYSYDQPGSQGNELEIFTIKQDGKVFLDMGAMDLGYQNGLDPNPIDVPQTIQNKEAGFYFSLPNLSKEGIFVPLDADGSWEDRGLWLDPTDTDPNKVITLPDGRTVQYGVFSRMVIDEEALSRLPDGNIATELYDNREVFSLGQNGENGFIEAGRIVQQNNQTVFQAFATIQGEAPIEDTVVVPASTSIPEINFDAPLTEKLPVTEISVPPPPPKEVVSIPTSETFNTTVAEFDEPPPIIPIGLAPRETLERTRRRIYNPIEPLSPEEEAEIQKGFSPGLRNNPNYNPDPKVDIPYYFEQQQINNSEYFSALESINRQVAQPMNKDCEMAIALAVAGHTEHKNIYRTLETYAVQVDKDGNSIWDTNKFELDILVNWPAGEDPSQTLDEIQRFTNDYKSKTGKDFPLQLFTHEVTNGQKELGLYKKMIFDIALLRKQQSNPGELYITMNDADMTYSNPRYLEGMLQEMKDPSNRNTDGILGRQDLDPQVYDRYPTFHAAMRFWQFMESTMRIEAGMIGSQGRNFVIKGSSYAAIGGNRTHEFWADTEFGKFLKFARRGTDRTPIQYSNANWVMVDPRREIDKFMSGEPVAKTWWTFNDREVRGTAINFDSFTDVDVSKLLSDPDEINKFNHRLQGELNMIIREFGPRIESDEDIRHAYASRLGLPIGAKTQEILKKSLELLGIPQDGMEFNLDDEGKLSITLINTDKLRQALKAYHDSQLYKTKIKNHPLPEFDLGIPPQA